ncbi:Zn-dependent hydrolase YycJ/WalJ, required for cell wall metabolism and coordination of cell division with DNA replication [Olavius algarvensis associated proteobacterium Delta 3]|nr:Zn-dependent hydrolase YycJ/WalJ, required for cell wall metabolism and coordination of cell division with DNA replication [Olavius algarvensis associated proteobacterium Delta 3]CAB5127219.1 Zn-dependent hydrolase YycJ/WalJ, required for cell wall metabolism and coordination of cell division with DNA replication [Olavius algarvensis associated proteobacterium Delta 3]
MTDPEQQTLSDERGNGIQLCLLASGSRGNAFYLSDRDTSLLVDAGLSGKEIERRMALRNLRPQDLTAIVVSHEHMDHIQGVGVLARRYHLPIFLSSGTREAARGHLGKITEIESFICGASFQIGRWAIRPFATSHDAQESAGFTFQQHGMKIGMATDLGAATALVREHLKDCRILILEANHDLEMLESGPYPWHLKQRIKSRLGHLSNTASRDLIGELLHDRLDHIILAHLSQTNNTPERARDAVAPVLNGHRASLSVAVQDTPSRLFHL